MKLRPLILLTSILPWSIAPQALKAAPERDAESYAKAIEKINSAHAARPAATSEDELTAKIPRSATAGLARVLKAKPSPQTIDALLTCGEAALDLAAMEHFESVRDRLLEIDADAAQKLGDAVARERFLVRGVGNFADGYLNAFADITKTILEAYDDVFGFQEWSKVPGKKIRIRVHLEDKITRPPHFAPQYPYHSEIDMPVIDAGGFRSPTRQGHMLFYGLCHELGHLIAMWGDRNTMEDHHAWAHYTGVVIVEHMANDSRYKKMLAELRDVRWRSLTVERAKTDNRVTPSLDDHAGVMALLLRLHDTVGTKAIGAALNAMDEKVVGHRINRVRYYSFDNFEKALITGVQDQPMKAAVRELFP